METICPECETDEGLCNSCIEESESEESESEESESQDSEYSSESDNDEKK
jgi:hypothetical protein